MRLAEKNRKLDGMKRFRLTGDARSAYLLILPFFVFFLLFVLYPLIQNFFTSLTNENLINRQFIGLNNFRRLMQDRSFLRSVRNTFVYAAFSIGPLMLFGFVAALCVDGSGRARAAGRAVLIFPHVLSMVSVSMIWLYLFEPGSGLFNKLLSSVGLPGSDWLFDERLALPCLILVNIWKSSGYVMMIDLAALQGVPQSLHEAARVDGAGAFSRIRHITLPAIRPVSYFLLATLSIECFKTFEQVRIMTNGGPVDATTTITHQIYMRAFSEFKMGYASAMSVVLFILILTVTLLNLRVGGQLDKERQEFGS
jgi:ABC-type sugar transport system permease subunit